ncbi:hypothetical protein [Amycolatopsis solani]|nr:hypothetical protein [Amycolatopsis sp. MEP2-6]
MQLPPLRPSPAVLDPAGLRIAGGPIEIDAAGLTSVRVEAAW